MRLDLDLIFAITCIKGNAVDVRAYREPRRTGVPLPEYPRPRALGLALAPGRGC